MAAVIKASLLNQSHRMGSESCIIVLMMESSSPQSIGDLFRSGDNWKLNACVNYIHDDWSLYAEGFHMGAKALIGEVVKDGGQSIDLLIYPVVFCFRHAIELQLKAAVHWGRRYLGRPSPDYPAGHILVSSSKGTELWKECRSIAKEVWPEGSNDELDDAERILRELEAHDRDGQAFRYPMDTKGERTKAALTHINIQEFYEAAERAYRLLDGISTGCEAMWVERMENAAP